jgi:peptidoglycan-N-acetylglucosamine deacetylase
VVFQFLFNLISPVMLPWSIAVTLNPHGASPAGDVPSSLATIGAYRAFFQMLDLATGCARPQCRAAARVWRIMPLLLIQRLCYRQLLYVTALRTGLTALEGTCLAAASSCVPCKVTVDSALRGAAEPIKHLQRQALLRCLF